MQKNIIILLTMALMLSACLPSQTPIDVQSQVNTAVAQTMQANKNIEESVNQTLTAQAPLSTPTAAFTATLVPTLAPINIITDTPAPLPTNTASLSSSSGSGNGGGGGSGNSGSTGSAYSCAVVAQKPHDGTTFKSGDSFDVTWTIKNTGTVTWEADWDFEYKGGTDMSPTGDFLIGKQVKPGQTISIVVEIEAPVVAYKDSGTIFVMTWSLNKGDHFCMPFIAIKVNP